MHLHVQAAARTLRLPCRVSRSSNFFFVPAASRFQYDDLPCSGRQADRINFAKHAAHAAGSSSTVKPYLSRTEACDVRHGCYLL